MSDAGQTLPLYIWLTGMLLFTAFALFAVAQAASARNGAQSAADAAALAAAQDARQELVDAVEDGIGQGDDWLSLLDGVEPPGTRVLGAAQALAADNDATVQSVEPVVQNGYPGFRVAVRTNYTAGKSIIPGTDKSANADAVAVIQPRCEVAPDADPKKPVQLDCDGDLLDIDPSDFEVGDLPDASVLFSVHLAE